MLERNHISPHDPIVPETWPHKSTRSRIAHLGGAVRAMVDREIVVSPIESDQRDDIDLEKEVLTRPGQPEPTDSPLTHAIRRLDFRTQQALSSFCEYGLDMGEAASVVKLDPVRVWNTYFHLRAVISRDPLFSATFEKFSEEVSQLTNSGWLHDYILAANNLPKVQLPETNAPLEILTLRYSHHFYLLLERFVDGPGFIQRFITFSVGDRKKKSEKSQSKKTEQSINSEIGPLRSAFFLAPEAKFSVFNPACGPATKAAAFEWIKLKFPNRQKAEPTLATLLLLGIHPSNIPTNVPAKVLTRYLQIRLAGLGIY